ncbi:hypothetical protein MGYG_01972 [Nannizzia gypsea CBS 118893]|uniref:BZIP domain-containing protein n=1 Tax=Arthroderma gypseum (strain ATCC MYA-4604 / CBS 118893) TaxID=535722 RepID=E5QZ51_ARTGP|nr:hypothetical protein MGYG_01972 [Nannizzia gypsea CBS 118893]EFQ98960.1 hypothetical protein MGYG_01972 [Nannizzia gypsea CBS 118893]
MSATACAPAGCVRQTIAFFQPSLASSPPLYNHPSSSSSTSINSHFSHCLSSSSSSSLTPPIADSSPFHASDPFATLFPGHPYFAQDQYPLSTAGQDIPDFSQSWELYDDPLQALLSTEDFDFSNPQGQVLIPSFENSPIQTPVSTEDSLYSMKDCDPCLLDIPLTRDAGSSVPEVNNNVSTVTNSVPTLSIRPDLSSTIVPDVCPSPESSSSSTTKSSGSRKRSRADDDNRSAEEIASEKRQRNTMAARRFRKRKEDRICSLEKQLADALKERDELRLQVARLEGQNMMLRKC